jgi:hypothetical protein
MAMPAGLPVTKRTSLLARMKQIKAPEISGESLAFKFHIKNPAKTRLAAVRIVHSIRAGSHGNMANGAMKIDVDGKYISHVRFCLRPSPDCGRSPPAA